LDINNNFIINVCLVILLSPFMILAVVGGTWLYVKYVTFVMEFLGVWKKEKDPRDRDRWEIEGRPYSDMLDG